MAGALRQELDRRRTHLDSTPDLYSVTITVKFEPGSAKIRSLQWGEEWVERRFSDRGA